MMDEYSNGSSSLDQEEMMREPSLSDEIYKPTHPLPSPSNPPPPKRSRRSVQKRVVSVPFLDAEGNRPKGLGECSPPSDSWAWRKYGQKPIKGSPYPRGYYRCSSSKGCPARKQVERSRADPATLVITYSFDHNHTWPIPKIHHRHANSKPESREVPVKLIQAEPITNQSESEQEDQPEKSLIKEEKFTDLITAPAVLDDFYWFGGDFLKDEKLTEDPLLYGSIFGAVDMGTLVDESVSLREKVDEALFAELDELPGCDFVSRRGRTGFSSWHGTATR